MGFIYLIINHVNGKRYVGKTNGTVEDRWKTHLAGINDPKNDNRSLYRAFRKYGIENFSIETIDTGESNEELNLLEQYWIDKLDTFQKEYNETRGGDGNTLYDRELIWRIYEKTGTIAETARQVGCDRRVVRAVLHLHNIHNETSQIKEVCQLDKDTGKLIRVYKNGSQASKQLNNGDQSKRTNILLACKEQWRTCGGFRWCYKEDLENYNIQNVLKIVEDRKKQKSKKLSESLKIYDDKKIIEMRKNGKSIQNIADEIGCSKDTVSNILNKNNIKIEISNQAINRVPKYDYQEIKRIYEQYQNQKKVSEIVGCDIGTVSRALKKMNVKTLSSAEVNQNKNYKKVLQIDINTNEIIKEFNSAGDAAESVTGSRAKSSNIRAVCNGKQKTAYGYKWTFQK